MQKINTLLSLSSLSILALTFALPACDEPLGDEDSVAQDDKDEPPRTGQILLEDGTELTYVVKNGNAMFEGDISLGDADELETSFRSAGSKVFPSAAAWPGGVVHFQIQPGFQSQWIVPAIAEFESKTGIRFINSPDAQGRFVLIGDNGPGSGCWANYGRSSNNQPTRVNISVADGCDTFRVLVHEFGHVVGLFHEHTRSDRDAFVSIVWDNIIATDVARFAYKKWKKTGLLGADLGPYDYDSVMHYTSRGFVVNDGKSNTYTMTRKDNGQPITRTEDWGLSAGDVAGIQFLYFSGN